MWGSLVWKIIVQYLHQSSAPGLRGIMVSRAKGSAHLVYVMPTCWQALCYQVNMHGLSSPQQPHESDSLTCQFYKWRHRLERLSKLPKLTQLLSDSSGIQTKPSDCKDECFSLPGHDFGRHFEHSTLQGWRVMDAFHTRALRLRCSVEQRRLHKETGNQGSPCSVPFIYKILDCIFF